MARKGKDMSLLNETAPEQAMEDVHELPDEELETVVGGINIYDRIKPPSDEKPPIEAPILNPFS